MTEGREFIETEKNRNLRHYLFPFHGFQRQVDE